MATTAAPRRAIEPRPEFAGILKEQEHFGTGTDDTADRMNSWFDTLMLQSGLGITPSVLLLLCLCGAITLGGLVFVLQENLLTTALAAAVGAAVPIAVTIAARSRRQKLLSKQLPAMIEELARAAKTGRSLDQCLQLVAEETPDPLGAEMMNCSRKLELGIPMRDALRELPHRTGLVATNLLVTTLVVNQQTGGDLVRILERLAATVRDRLMYLGRVQAATAASRATAILMLVLPPAILAFFTFRDPAYLTDLMASSWGRMATLIAFGLEIIGVIWVMRIFRNTQRG